jgi:hypothetical protein
MTMLLVLAGCTTRYDCGEYTVDTTLYGTLVGGEWCGLFGTYGFQDAAGDVQIIVTPNAADSEVDAALTTVVAVTDLRFPGARLAPGERITLDDDLSGVCGVAPGGAGSGTIRFDALTRGEVEIGREVGQTLTGDIAYVMRWDVSCPGTHTMGDDRVELGSTTLFDL